MGFGDLFSALRGEQGASHMLDVYFNDLTTLGSKLNTNFIRGRECRLQLNTNKHSPKINILFLVKKNKSFNTSKRTCEIINDHIIEKDNPFTNQFFT